MVRSQRGEINVEVKRGPWTPDEDQKLLAYIRQHGHGGWRALPAKAGLQRCGKSCRLRWFNYLRPDIKRGNFSLHEELAIIQLHALLGNRWSVMATYLPQRTDNEIKNYWNSHLKKRLDKMGIDPVTHKPKSDALIIPGGSHNTKDAANLSHMAQWESVRLEAEARFVQQSQLGFFSSSFARHGVFSSMFPGIDIMSTKTMSKFSKNTFSVAANIGFDESSVCSAHEFGETSTSCGGGIMVENEGNNWNYPENLDQISESAWTMHDIYGMPWSDECPPPDDSTSLAGNAMEDLSADTFVYKVHFQTEENKTYWNGILNVANASPSGSAVLDTL